MDGSSDSSSNESESASSSDGEDEAPEPQIPVVEVKVEPENNKRWNLSEFLPGKSPNDAPLSHEPVEPKIMEEHEDDDMQRTPSDHHYDENSNSSSVPEKSDESHEPEDRQMPPPAKVKSPSKTPEDKTPDTDISSVLSFITNLHNIQPISSISDSDDNGGSERPPKKKRPKKERPRLPKDIEAADSSSDESSRFSESRRRSSIDESKRGRKSNFPVNPYDATNTSSDTNSPNGAKKTKKSPRKESQRKQPRTNRRRPSISRKTIPSSEGSSDEAPKPAKVKDPKKMPKKKPKSPEKIATSDDESENERRPTKHSPFRQSPPVPPHMTSSSSEHSEDSESCGEVKSSGSKKIEKIVSDKNKNDMVRKLFNVTKVASEGGKGGKGGAKAKGQVVVITPEDVQSQVKPSEEKFISAAPVIVRIELSRIDLDLLSIPPEKLKNVIRTKSPAVPIVEPPPPQRKPNKRKRSDEQDRWRKPGFDQLSVSSSSSASSEIMDNPAAPRIASAYTTNYTNDRLNNNIAEHKTKDFYHSPSSVDTKLPKIKKEHRASPLKTSTNDFRNIIKQETVKKEEFDGTQMRARASSLTNNSRDYKKRKRMDGAGENSLPLPPTNHERLPMNGDVMAKPEVVKKVYVSYFERTNDEIEQQEPR